LAAFKPTEGGENRRRKGLELFEFHRWFAMAAILNPNDYDVANTVVSNHFHSVKILLFSSARSRDFDGTPGTELPVSMYTTQTPIDM
jgi:hypothetical protein